jgi:transcriptional regulator with XRE-family HTH domain
MVLAEIKVRKDKLAELRAVAELDSDAELARKMGVNQSSLTRVIHGNAQPGNKFIAGLLQAFGGEQWFERLFILIPGPKK